jgi:uncharacterized protein YecE (DUF72 family)
VTDRGQLYVGTSGFSYSEWKPEFYPADLPAKRFLPFYAERFPSVEINATFYRMPTEKVLASWMDETPDGFKLTLKASQRITHVKRLKEADEEVSYFLNVSKSLGDKLGVILFQCPPNLKHDQERLETFVASLPGNPYRFAFEFRHDSWASDEVFELLSKNGCAWCVSDTREKPAPMRATDAPFVYMRLRGVDYTDDEVERWFAATDDALASGKDAWVYFKHEDDPSGIRYAQRMLERFRV